MKIASFHFALILFAFILLSGCSRNTQSHEPAGNEFERLVKKLHKNPDDEKSIRHLKQLYQENQQSHLKRIEELQKIYFSFNGEKILTEYELLQRMFEDIEAVPGLGLKIRPVNYSATLSGTRNKLIEQLNDAATNMLATGDKSSCRRAYLMLQKLKSLRPENSETENRIKQSLQCAAISVAINDPTLETRYSQYNAFVSRISADVIAQLKSKNITPYLQVENSSTMYDETISFHITHFETGTITEDKNTRDVVNNVPYTTGGRRGNVTAGSSPATATITSKRISSVSYANLELKITAPDGRVADKTEMTARYEWNSEQNTYTGDRRALSMNDRAQLRNTDKKNPPSETELAEELVRQLKEKILHYFQNRYASL